MISHVSKAAIACPPRPACAPQIADKTFACVPSISISTICSLRSQPYSLFDNQYPRSLAKLIERLQNNTTMSSQSYQLPTQTSGYGSGTVAGEGSAGPLVSYVCGDCNSKVQLSKGDIIRCHMCGHRVLYKERTKRYVHMSDHIV
jgi:DNA-directed RNA polymerases I, II, and III subunit RPABC4